MMSAPAPRRRLRRGFVTGASAGIGAAFAERLAREQYELILVARNRERLEERARQLREDAGAMVEVLAADLTQPAGLLEAERKLAAEGGVEMLVNSAGFGTVGCFDVIDIDREEEEIRLNVVALVRLTRAALPPMLARRSGTIINVSSIAAFVPSRYTATYCATKAYVNSFTEALYEELRGTNVRVQALCPGFTRTEFEGRAGVDTTRIPQLAWTAPEAVVEASLAALRSGNPVCVPGLANRATTILLRTLPHRWVRRLVGAGAKRGWARGRRSR